MNRGFSRGKQRNVSPLKSRRKSEAEAEKPPTKQGGFFVYAKIFGAIADGSFQLTVDFLQKIARTNGQFFNEVAKNCGVSSTFHKCMIYSWRMADNYFIFRTAKLKTHQDVTNVLKEQHRAEDYDSHRADETLSHLNDYSSDYEQAMKQFDELLPKQRRKNAVVGLNFIVTTSEEFSSKAEELAFYDQARNYIAKNFGRVVGWAIHRDETSTHMQVVTIPLVDGKLNARQLIGGDRNRMKRIQTDFFETVGKEFGLKRGVDVAETKAVHKTVEQKHREKEKELQQREKAIAEREKQLEKKMARFEQDRAFDERAERVVQSMCEEGKFNENSKSRDLFGALRQVVKGFAKAQEKLNKLLKSPLDTVFNWVADAKSRGCSDLFSYFQQKEQERKRQQQQERNEEKKRSFSR